MGIESIINLKEKIDRELIAFSRSIKRVKKLSPATHNYLKEFLLRKGKRIRPLFFALSYLGYAKRTAPGLFKTAIAVELIHNFILIHDDIIDRSELRRGLPSLHARIEDEFSKKRKKFTGQDIAIVVGDIIFAMGIQAFLSIREDRVRKEKGLYNLLESALHTGCGEINELLYSLKDLDKITQKDIYRIYDQKSAHYTFVTPLVIGAILAGAGQKEINHLTECGLSLGRAFQVRDDLLGVFSNEESLGKSPLTDIQEGKRTLLIWYAYKNSNQGDRKKIKRIFLKTNVSCKDLSAMRQIIIRSGARSFALKEIHRLTNTARKILTASKLREREKKDLQTLIHYIFGKD
ncbi:MAG: polyprenyl synthetase family protein [Candidatus Margulisiibacteriota bacterium]